MMIRLLTFKEWNYSAVNIISLAKIGFSYTGAGDKVECQYCHGRLFKWKEEDDPFTEHKKHFPECPFILQTVQDNKRHLEPMFQDLSVRIGSYHHPSKYRTPNEMAAAGFFYTGLNDMVKCFHCGLVQRMADLDYDPFKIHRIFSPGCAFIRNITNFQSLGITVKPGLQAREGDKIQKATQQGLVKDPGKQKLIDSISEHSLLFQHLLER